MLLKCKICGGDLDVVAGTTIGTCQYCGSTMTLPKIDNDQKARLFNRAHQYRLNCNFDRAYDAYKTIVDTDEQDAEAYWGMLLSEYGIEYVDDPTTGKKIPTCHRTQVTSPLQNANYKLAIQYAEPENRFMYEEECNIINKIQKKILAISSQVENYDVFICYKETNDLTGERTLDSVIAQDIYKALTNEGLKVFFSRITLQDKLGVDYEPYIYSALKSAKVLLLVTTSADNCDAVWVKNEWMRFLRMMQEESQKVIIPVIKDLTGYELPDELSGFQAQDMNKIGAIQDLVMAVQKLVQNRSRKENDVLLETILEEKRQQERIKKRLVPILYSLAIVGIVALAVGGFKKIYKNVIYPSSYVHRTASALDNNDYSSAYKNVFQLYNYYGETIDVDGKEITQLLESGEIDKITELLIQLEIYHKDPKYIYKSLYLIANAYYENQDYQNAGIVFLALKNYKDSHQKMNESFYKAAEIFDEEHDYYNESLCYLYIDTTYEDAHDKSIDVFTKYILSTTPVKPDLKTYMTKLDESHIDEIINTYASDKNYKGLNAIYDINLKCDEIIKIIQEIEYNKLLKAGRTDYTLKLMYQLSEGITLKSIIKGITLEQGKYVPAKETLEEWCELYYREAMDEYNKSNYKEARDLFGLLPTYHYKNSVEMQHKCILMLR